MNYVALILVGKIIAWFVLVLSTALLGLRFFFHLSYLGSAQEKIDQFRGIKRSMIWKFQLTLFLLSLFTIAALWGR